MENVFVPKLRDALIDELENREPYLSLRAQEALGRQRQSVVLTKPRYFVYILEKHILEHTCTVVLTVEITEECYILRLCRPLSPKEYGQLADSQYVPMLRSKIPMTVGLGESGGVLYAFSSVKLSQHCLGIELLDTLLALEIEINAFLA